MTSTSATLDGTVDPDASATTYHFDWGTSASYGTSAPAPPGDAGAGSSPETVTASLAGLAPSTKYHYRLVATSSAGTPYGSDATFTTQPATSPGPAPGPLPGPTGSAPSDTSGAPSNQQQPLDTVATAVSGATPAPLDITLRAPRSISLAALLAHGIEVSVSSSGPGAISARLLLPLGYDPTYGARPLKRALRAARPRRHAALQDAARLARAPRPHARGRDEDDAGAAGSGRLRGALARPDDRAAPQPAPTRRFAVRDPTPVLARRAAASPSDPAPPLHAAPPASPS